MKTRKNRQMLIGIVGLGKFGMYLAETLAENGKDIMCIDQDETKVKKVIKISQAAFVSEDLSINTLEETGFKNCDIIAVCISEHMDSSIFATLNCLALRGPKVISLAASEEQGTVLEKLGAEVIYPYKDSVERLVKKIMNNNFLDFISLNDNVEIVEVKIPSSLVGKSIIESDIRKKFGINIIAIETVDEIITNIDPNYILKNADALVVIGEKKFLRKFENLE